MIDLRSDTVTKPSAEMIEAMQKAAHNGVGDDVFKEDPTTNLLEQKIATMFGMEDALFCPTGTMTNQIAIKCHTQPGEEVICEEYAHVYQNEVGGIAFHAGCSVKLLQGKYGLLQSNQIESAINNLNDIHKPKTSLLCLENTSNRGGGTCYEMKEFKEIKKICTTHQLNIHLDGARLFNAIIATNQSPKDYGSIFDSISICLSKSLGCPIGSLLLGNKSLIQKARKYRKLFGGGMRQVGVIAAAGLYALDNNIQRLKIDHQHTALISNALKTKEFIQEIYPGNTNIIIFNVKENFNAQSIVNQLAEKNILCFAIAKNQIRMVLHLDITESDVQYIIQQINNL